MDAPQELERTGTEYAPKAMALLETIAGILREEDGLEVEGPYDMSDDQWLWALSVRQSGLDNVDVLVEMPRAAEYADDPEDGLSFGLNVVAEGGRMLGGFQPYNFTDRVWVRASEPYAVAGRWTELEGAALQYAGSGKLAEDIGQAPEVVS